MLCYLHYSQLGTASSWWTTEKSREMEKKVNVLASLISSYFSRTFPVIEFR